MSGLSNYPPGHPTSSGTSSYDGGEKHWECHKCSEFDPKKTWKTIITPDGDEEDSDTEYVCREVEKGEVCGGDVVPAQCECGALATSWYTEAAVNYGQVVCDKWPSCQ